MLVFLLLHCLILHPPVLYSTDDQNILKEIYCMSNSFLIKWMSHTLKGWIWYSDMALLVYVEDELKGCMPRGYLEHTHHATPHNLHVHCPVTVEKCDPGCNEDHMQHAVWGWNSSSCHRWSVRLAVPCEWIAGLFGTCYMNRNSMSSTENMRWGKQIFQPSAVFSVVPTSVYYTMLPYFVLFTHDVCFMHEAIFNSWNNHIHNDDNPHATLLKWYQQQFAVVVWAGIVSDYLTGL
jgi:hypothetical protein